MSTQNKKFDEKQQIAVVCWLVLWLAPACFLLLSEWFGTVEKVVAVAWIIGFILLSYYMPKFWLWLNVKFFGLFGK